MKKQQVRQRIEKLKKLINYHRYLYHVLDRQEISDAALDSLKKELFDLEQKFPEFITADSPTQRVGGKPLEKFKKVKHSKAMLSFNDAFSEEDMRDWLKRISKLLTSKEAKLLTALSHPAKRGSEGFYCELKIDGLAIELIYENETLKIGSTRGNGIIGENVTQNLKTIEAIPLGLRRKKEIIADFKKWKVTPFIIKAIKSFDFKKPIVARGEIFISQKEFERINKQREKADLPIYANPRNLAAGSVRQLDPKITASRHLDSFAYDLITVFGNETHEEKHRILKAFGFKINYHNKYCRNLGEVFKFYKHCQGLREKLSYGIDGIVVIVNSNKIFEKLGVVGKAPRGAIALKFPFKEVTTLVENIKVQVGRTGALTPVAYLKPVKVGGVTISRATLHNEDEIKRLGVRIGDTVIVARAGDVIPDIVKVLPELRTGRERKFKMPTRCPVCGSKTVKTKGEVVSRCHNPNCFAQKKKHFCHFVSRGAFDMVGLGAKIIARFIEEGLVFDPADLFELKEGDILPLERFAEKSAKNLIAAIRERKEITLPRFIYALGIRNVGEETARDLAKYFSALGGPASGWGSLAKLQKSTLEDLEKIQDIGPVVSESIHDWFSQKRNQNFLGKFKQVGVKIKNQKSLDRFRLDGGETPRRAAIKNQKLKGKTFVLTGSLEAISREKAKEKIRELGGDISEAVSKKTDFVIVGKDPGSKYEKAKKLSIKTVNEREFLKMIT